MTTSKRDGCTDRRERRRIQGPDELVQAVPYLLGFHPADSLVLVALDHGELIVTARLDLADLDGDAEDAAYLLDRTVGAATTSGANEFIVVVYSDDADTDAAVVGGLLSSGLPGDGASGDGASGDGVPPGVARLRPGAHGPAGVTAPWLPESVTVHAVRHAVGQIGGRLLDAVLVRAGRSWSYLCTSPCCPPDGRPLPDAPSEFVLAATVDGMVAARDRTAAAASLDPWSDDRRAAMTDLLAAAERTAVAATVAGKGQRRSRSDRRALFAAARACHEAGWVAPEVGELARLAVALRSIDTRDALWLAIEDGRLDGRPLMHELARRCPEPYDATPSFLYGWACWRSGNSMLAGVAAGRALASDPACTAAAMLASAVQHGMDPRAVPRIRRRPVRDRRRTGQPGAAAPTGR